MELGLIAEYEEREAAVHSQIPWLRWLKMPTVERAACVAHYRLSNYVSIHGQDAVMHQSELDAARKAHTVPREEAV